MKGRIQDIEILRAVAVLSVLLHHARDNLFTWKMPLTEAFFARFELWWGVDLFFVISGFVIARELLPRLGASMHLGEYRRITLAFWVRRAFRLLPSAWLWLLVILLACRFLNSSGAFGTLQANLAATLAGVLQFANFRFADSFFRYEYGASFVYWSLSLEEQFYLLLPLLVLVTRRWLPLVLLAVILIQFFTWRTPLLMVIRTDAIAWGVLLAIFSNTPLYHRLEPEILRYRLLGLAAFGIALLALMAISSERFLWSFWRLGAIALISAALVWIASYDRHYLAISGWPRNTLVWVGSRSYAIYLTHVPAFFLTREIWFRIHGSADWGSAFTLPFAMTAAALILAGAELNYRWIESPLRRLGSQVALRISTRSTSPTVAATNEVA